MRQFAIIIIIIVFSNDLVAQSYSLTLDSLTKKYLSQVSKKKKKIFENLIKQRLTTNLLKRIDTTTFDYAFITETYCSYDSRVGISERYFLFNDSIPKYVYFDGKINDPKKIYDGFLIWYSANVTYSSTLYPSIKNYSKLKSNQELAYDKKQIWHHGCVVYQNVRKKFVKETKNRLRKTYQIQTMIDKKNKKVIVSIQLPPKNPKFETIGYNAVWDW
jgi:hypothetical protein